MSSIITTINSDNGGFLGKKYHPGNGLELTEANVFNVLVDNDSMKVNEENKLESKKYQAGNGLELTDANVFNVLIDNDSIKINEENKLEATNKNDFWEESEGQLVPKNYDNEVRAKNLPFKNSAGTNIFDLSYDDLQQVEIFAGNLLKFDIIENRDEYSIAMLYIPLIRVKINNPTEKLNYMEIKLPENIEFGREKVTTAFWTTQNCWFCYVFEYNKDGTGNFEYLDGITASYPYPCVCFHLYHLDQIENDYRTLFNLNDFVCSVHNDYPDVTIYGDFYNFAYFDNFPEIQNEEEEVDVLAFDLPQYITDQEGNQLERVVCKYNTTTNSWIIPVIYHDSETTSYIVDTFTCEPNTYGPGILLTTYTTEPKSLILRGEMMMEWLPSSAGISTTVLKADIIEADNAFKLYKSPVPFMYKPKEVGEITIDNDEFWFISFGYIDESVVHQPVEFHAPDFGFDYVLSRSENGWLGKNLYVNTNQSEFDNAVNYYNTEKDYVYYPDETILYAYIKKSPINKFLLKKLLNSEDNGLEYNWAQSIIDSGKLKSLYDHSGWHEFNTTFSSSSGTININGNDEEVWIIGVHSHKNDEEMKKYDIKLVLENEDDENVLEWKWKNKLIYQISIHESMEGQEAVQDVIILISFDKSLSINVDDKTFLSNDEETFENISFLCPKNGFLKRTNNDYDGVSNPFLYVLSTMNYNIIPKPEACSTLYTNYNIRTSGIVMGANLETAVYKVNTLGSEVGVIENDITDLKQAVQSLYNICAQLEAEINSVESDLDWMTITDAVFGFVGAAASGVKTFITKSANVFKAGERDVIRAAENQVHLSADSVRVGQRTIAREEEGAVHISADEAHFESCGIANEEHNVLFNPDEITMRDIAGNETALTNEGLRIANGGNVARLTPQTLDIGAFNASILNEADDLLGRLNINGRPFARLVYNLKDLGMKLYHDMAFQKLLSGVLTISWIGSTVVDIVKFGMNQTKEKTYIDVSADLLILQQLIDKWASFNDFEQGNNLNTSLATAETINRVINERAHPVNSVFMTTGTIDVSNYLGFSWVLLKSDDGINFYKRTA